MTFADLVAGDTVVLVANTLIHHFTLHPRHGAAATDLVKRSVPSRNRVQSTEPPN